ncbi:hypothetical protein [Ruegeria arenilitoris]|uniref:hypothetical protein n=1 Tax=Ruegeria arenilitoris TaxID=1173585 RepID=UPI00147ABD07|nr:hypothetical protein [Ruegeria arenilitoris]
MSEAEVITACENVCRDFSFMRHFGPWIGPALLASATALIIAFRAYPWQKQLDRSFELDVEKRRAYAAFFASLIDLFGKAHAGDSRAFVDALVVSRKCFNSLVFYAPEEVVSACRDVIDKILEYRDVSEETPSGPIKHYNDALELELIAIRVARDDIVTDDCDSSRVVGMIYRAAEER